jgi:hypothetical protein
MTESFQEHAVPRAPLKGHGAAGKDDADAPSIPSIVDHSGRLACPGVGTRLFHTWRLRPA